MTAAIVIEPGPQLLTRELPDVALATLQQAVNGFVATVPSTEILAMYCDEDARLLRRPLNPWATRLWALFGGELHIAMGDHLAGPVVVTSVCDKVPPSLLAIIEHWKADERIGASG